VRGTTINPIKYPIVMMVDATVSSLIQFRKRREMETRKKKPQINASFDKNCNQPIVNFV
jgi:hypothetical protein